MPLWFQKRLDRFRRRLQPTGTRFREWSRPQKSVAVAAVLAVAGTIYFDSWVATCGFEVCPSGREIRSFEPPQGGRILDRYGVLLGRLQQVRRVNVSLDAVPTHVRQAFVATEDRRFFAHRGLDWTGVARATARNVAAGGVREGFSTITMQVARNTFVARKFDERSLKKKLIELRVARLIEKNLTKDRILELYLNVIYLGNGVYGVEAASRDLFGKSVNQLSLSEAAVLAALPKAPSRYSPRRNPKRVLDRRNLVLQLMVREGYVNRAQALAAAGQRMRIAENEWIPPEPNASYALDEVRSLVDSVLRGQREEIGDLVVVTSLDATAQRAAERSVRRRATAIRTEGAMVALDPRNGDIRAMVGGRTYQRAGFNRATRARRQPGSTFKPFVYAAALVSGLSPGTMVDDEPIEVVEGGRVWSPRNFGDEYQGTVTLRRALMKSSNAATVRLSRSIGEQRVINEARVQGIHSPLSPRPSLALGAYEVTPMELATAYSPFANGGFRVVPRLVRRIGKPDGTVLWTQEEAEKTPVLDPRVAYELTSMLRAAIDYGTGRVVRDMGVKTMMAGKTGTTNSGTDVWFVGYTPSLVAVFWFGRDDPSSLGSDASGGRLAAPAWADFFLSGWREKGGTWRPPEGMVPAVIDPTTGEIANEWCPTRTTEYYRPSAVPTVICRFHSEPVYEPEYSPLDTIFEDVQQQADSTWNDAWGRARKAIGRVFGRP